MQPYPINHAIYTDSSQSINQSTFFIAGTCPPIEEKESQKETQRAKTHTTTST